MYTRDRLANDRSGRKEKLMQNIEGFENAADLDDAVRMLVQGLVGIGWDPKSAISFVLNFGECR